MQRAVDQVEQDVVRLEVAVHDAAAVRGRERLGDLRQQRGRLGRGQRPPFVQVVAQAAALDEVHDQAERRADGDEVADPDDVRVAQHQQDRALRHEPVDRLGLGHEVFAQQLDRDLLVADQGAGPPHGARPAAADRLDQFVGVTDAKAGQVTAVLTFGLVARVGRSTHRGMGTECKMKVTSCTSRYATQGGSVGRCPPSQVAMHDMEVDQPVFRALKTVGDRAHDEEPE